MLNLHELQSQFQNLLLQQASSIPDEIISTENISATTRLNIYADAYYLRFLEILTQDYDVLSKLMGEEDFDQLVRCFIYILPSQFRSVRWFGNTLPDFLRTTEPYAEKSWLAEMATFEWLLNEAFDEQDSPLVTVEEMAAIPFERWPEMRFKLTPSLRRINFNWNITPVWKSIKNNDTQPVAIQKSDDLIPLNIWRKAFVPQFISLSPDEAFMIDAMSAGKNFSEICEGLCEWVDEENTALHAALLLKRFIVDELISEITFDFHA